MTAQRNAKNQAIRGAETQARSSVNSSSSPRKSLHTRNWHSLSLHSTTPHTHTFHNGLNHRTRRIPRNSPSPLLGHQRRLRERCFCRQPRSRQERPQAGRPQGPRALRTSTMLLRLPRHIERYCEWILDTNAVQSSHFHCWCSASNPAQMTSKEYPIY
jgi:hypothetical protein